MNKILLTCGLLGGVLVSCGSRQVVMEQKPSKERINPTGGSVPQSKLRHSADGEDFFRENIAKGNNSTISYGSIVGARPIGYTVTRNYFPSVGQGFRTRYIILHYTAIDNEASVRALTQREVSAHYLVSDLEDKEIWQIVDENKRAYHAGVSTWRNDRNLNDSSIGIEIVNKGFIEEAGKRIYYDFPEHQIRKVAMLVKDIANRYNILPNNILAHSDVAPLRKSDPGPKFPWKRLYEEYGIGMWYDTETRDRILSEIDPYIFDLEYGSIEFVTRVQKELKKFGYGIEVTGVWDKPTALVIEVFQHRFRPEKYDGVMDRETWSILQSLTQKYAK